MDDSRNEGKGLIYIIMEIVKVFKPKKKSFWFFMLFGSAILIFGAVGTVIAFNSGFRTPILEGDWIYLIQILQGIIFFNMGYAIMKKGRFFVGWDETEIRYLLPGCKEVVTIRIADITDISLKLFEVRIWVNDTVKNLDLKDIEYNPLRKIKDYFKELQSSISH